MTGSIILMISHGYSVKEHDDPFVDVVEAAVNGFSECTEPGAYLVDIIPLRKSQFHLWHTAGGTNSIFLSLCGQCDTCLHGSPERDGKGKPSDSRTC